MSGTDETQAPPGKREESPGAANQVNPPTYPMQGGVTSLQAKVQYLSQNGYTLFFYTVKDKAESPPPRTHALSVVKRCEIYVR